MRFKLYYIGHFGPLSGCLDPLAPYTEFIEMANAGAWSDCFGALFEVGILPVPLVAAAVCTAVWKAFRKAIPFAALKELPRADFASRLLPLSSLL